MLKIENPDLFDSHLRNGINLFLGAGFSTLARGLYKSTPKSLPVGSGLRKEMLEHFERDPNSKLELPQLCQIISGTQRAAFNDFLRSRFTVVDFNDLYKNLERLNIKSIFTTNIDDLPFKIFSDGQKYYINDISIRGPSIDGATAIDYIALHGSVVHAQSEVMDFSPVEISSSFERDKDKWYSYLGRIQKTATLYWGYSMADAGVLQALSKDANNKRDRAPAWIVLRTEDNEAIEYYTALGFQIIIGDTEDVLKHFSQLKVEKTPGASKRLLSKRFKEYLLPEVQAVPVRTLTEFYLGAEPIWYDIYLGNLHKTKYVGRAENSIAGGRNCILIGGAITGKTTLLKQLARGVVEPKQALYINDITPEKAKLLLRDIDAEGSKVVAFVDNAADSWEAINVLASSANIQIIAAERDYIFDSVGHRFSRKIFEVFDVSGLAAIDVQAVQDKIPSGLQRMSPQQFLDGLKSDLDPTFFEVLDSCISGHLLTDRFIDALKELKHTSPIKHDLLVLSCYLYSCRIPTSVDVAYAYVGKRVPSVTDVYTELSNIPTLLSPYEGGLADTDQAFFVPRSRNVAEAVIRRISPAELRVLLTDFHSSVSPSRISRYDIFRRMAYDANLTTRAFPDWEEGLAFYENCRERDNSASFLQQGAIYLSRKKQFPLSFKWIDDAMIRAGRKSASVRNTYAVVLFNANYDKNNPNVINTLDESMSILQKCYKDDLRKVYHAKVFADQAVKYASKFQKSPASIDYIDQASVWLKAELQQREGDRSINQLLRDLRTARRPLVKQDAAS